MSGDPSPLTVLLVQDAGAPGLNPAPAAAPGYLPTTPHLAYGRDASPALSLTIVLDRQPMASDATLGPLIRSAAFNLGVTLELTQPEKAELAAAAKDGHPPLPLFGRSVTFSLMSGTGSDPLATVAAIGAEAAAQLTATLGHADTLDVLAALDRTASSLSISCRVTYRTVEQPRTVRVTGTWATLYDALMARADAASTIHSGEIASAIADLIWAGRLHGSIDAMEVAGAVSAADIAPITATLLSASRFMLIPVDGATATNDALFVLGRRPSPLMPLQLSKTELRSDFGDVSLTASLDKVIGGALADLDRTRYIALVAAGNGGLIPAVTRNPELLLRSRGHEDPPAAVGLVAKSGGLHGLPLVLTPDSSVRPIAAALLASGVVQVAGAGVRPTFVGDDVIIPAQDLEIPPSGASGPLVDPVDAPLYFDLTGEPDAMQWYAPAFETIQPQATADATTSPFLFTFSQGGMTSGPDPRPGLKGKVRLTLSPTMSDATRAAVVAAGTRIARPVNVEGLSVSLEIPFIDQASGQTKSNLFGAGLQPNPDGTTTASIELLDEWVRLAYGALAYSDFQSQPPRVHVSYAYRGYQFASQQDAVPLVGGKIVAWPQLDPRAKPDERFATGFDAANLTLQLPTGRFIYERERLASESAPFSRGGGQATPNGGSGTQEHTNAVQTSAGRLAPNPGQHHVENTISVRAPTTATSGFPPQPGRHLRMLRSFVHVETHDVLFPCSTLGGLYRQSTELDNWAVGCQDVLRLGSIHYQQYLELPQLATFQYRVYRSLQQPGRFLVVPAIYRITRYSPTETPDRAYRPVMLVYGQIKDDPTKSQYLFSATLQPDIPYYARRALIDKLAAFSPATNPPVLSFPTDPLVQASLALTWTAIPGMAPPQVLLSWDSLQVTIAADLGTALTLIAVMEHTGVSGSITCTLADGLVVTSALHFGTQVVGPFDQGPVAVTVDGPTATLTNRIEQAVVVTDLWSSAGGGHPTAIPVETKLAAADSKSVPVPTGTTDAFVEYQSVSGPVTLQELDIFVEDVLVKVTFVNLVNYQNHGLQALAIECRVQGSQATHGLQVDQDQQKAVSVDLVLPITSYLQRQVIEYRVTKSLTTGASLTTPWLPWDLSQGNIVSITWDVIGP